MPIGSSFSVQRRISHAGSHGNASSLWRQQAHTTTLPRMPTVKASRRRIVTGVRIGNGIYVNICFRLNHEVGLHNIFGARNWDRADECFKPSPELIPSSQHPNQAYPLTLISTKTSLDGLASRPRYEVAPSARPGDIWCKRRVGDGYPNQRFKSFVYPSVPAARFPYALTSIISSDNASCRTLYARHWLPFIGFIRSALRESTIVTAKEEKKRIQAEYHKRAGLKIAFDSRMRK